MFTEALKTFCNIASSAFDDLCGNRLSIPWLRPEYSSCEAVTALCKLIDELVKGIQHLELECISTRYLLSQHMDGKQGNLLHSDSLENMGRRHYDSLAYQLF